MAPDLYTKGQVGVRPYACVWTLGDPAHPSCRELARVHDPESYMRAFIAVAFSPDGNTLVTVGSDDKHTLLLWNWRGHTHVYPIYPTRGV